nr:MAG TPA: hypothetical protein [Caudoviricetes sp.]
MACAIQYYSHTKNFKIFQTFFILWAVKMATISKNTLLFNLLIKNK